MTNRSGSTVAEPGTGTGPGQGARIQRPARPAGARAPDRRTQRRWVPVAARWLALLIGLADIIEGLRPGLYYHYQLHRLTEVTDLTRTADVIIGLLLVMLSHGLRRRKRRAWQAVVLLLGSNLVLHALLRHTPPHIAPMVVTGGLLVALVCYQAEFYATGDPRTRWRALWALVALAIADIVMGLAYLGVTGGLAGHSTLWQRIQSVILNLLGFVGPVHFSSENSADHFGFLTGGLGLFTLAVVGFLFLRPAEPAGRLRAADATAIRRLLDQRGDQDSLGYFALRTDKSVIWSPTGKSCICYRVLSGVMLASGDPIGDPEAWPGAIHAFLDEAARHAWVPAVIGCGEQGAEVWCREGNLTALELGDEAVVSVADFSLDGRAMRNVRQMVKRVGRQGYSAEVRRVADIPEAEIRRLVRQADSWRGSPTERGFSMALGRVGGKHDDRCVVATATEDGVLRALLHFVPWGEDGLSLDLMRRDRSAAPGLNDFMIVETIRLSPDLGVRRISLNFAVFRAALERGERIGAGPVLRAWRGILLFMSRWFQIESLYKFNAKFCPQWVPRFLVFPSTRDAPRIGLAALEAEAFLVWPTLGVRRIARSAGLGRLRRRLSGGASRRPAASR
ncbi:MAG TPA: phosphatidylglycerol lysyltransferase domain-containing protein [Streptosporangiaceae bacterium]